MWVRTDRSGFGETLRDLAWATLSAAAFAALLHALLRIADGLLLNARVRALKEYEDAYSPEERELIIHRIKSRSMRE